MRTGVVLPGAAVTPDPDAVAVGEIVGAHALRGLLRVRPYQPAPPSLAAGRRVLLERDGAWSEAQVTHAGAHGRGMLLLGLDGVSDRTAADALRGVRLLARLADLPALDRDEYYHHEVLGFTVETTDGAVIGTIAAIMANGLHDVWEVRAGAREHLIPVVADIVRAIDREARRVRIDPIPGLLD
jgi:16S rRNA processing protein RimM